MSNNTVPIITIDGPSGVGKGTIAAQLSHQLNWHLLDSGKIYRVLAYAAIHQSVNTEDEPAISDLGRKLDIRFSAPPGEAMSVFLNNEDVTEHLYDEGVGNIASIIAQYPSVRAVLLQKQRDFQQVPGLVADGRDMGTVVFPDAPLKIFLTASAEERAKRRYKQLNGQGKDAILAQLEKQIAERDERDMKRTTAPLKAAADATTIDTTELNIAAVMAIVTNLLNSNNVV